MRVALFHNLPSGGAKRHTLHQLRGLAERGHQLVEFAPTTADVDYCSFAPYVQAQRVFESQPVSLTRRHLPLVTPYVHCWQVYQGLRRTRSLSRHVAEEIDRDVFDIALVKDCQIMPSPYILRYLQIPTVFQCHHVYRSIDAHDVQGRRSPLSWLKWFYYRPARALVGALLLHHETENIQSASRVLTNSQFSRDCLARRYGVTAQVVYPGIDTLRFTPDGSDRASYVLSVGSVTRQKGHRFVVAALARLHADQRPPLLIAANSADPAEEEFVRRLAAECSVDLRIEQIQDDQRMVQVYREAKLFVYAPFGEALGLAPLEAMACGTPVVAVGEGGVLETVRDGVTGCLVERDAARFAGSVRRLMVDDGTRRLMGEAGRDYVRREWSWRVAVDRLERELLQAACGQLDSA